MASLSFPIASGLISASSGSNTPLSAAPLGVSANAAMATSDIAAAVIWYALAAKGIGIVATPLSPRRPARALLLNVLSTYGIGHTSHYADGPGASSPPEFL